MAQRAATFRPRRAKPVRRIAHENEQAYRRQQRRELPTYSMAWRRLRAEILAAEPLCRMCMSNGVVTRATEVDHIDEDATNNDPANLQPLCKPCHSRKTRAAMGRGGQK